MTEALFGTEAIGNYTGGRDSIRPNRQHGGYWRQGPPKRGSRVSAVLLGEHIYPWRIVAEMPKLWINPWAEVPLSNAPPLQTFAAHDTGEIYDATTSTATPDSIFQLPDGWPGFGR
jgi:hypothetical protein